MENSHERDPLPGASAFEEERDRVEYSPPVPDHPVDAGSPEESTPHVKHDDAGRMTN